jgi:hypothetical protein
MLLKYEFRMPPPLLDLFSWKLNRSFCIDVNKNKRGEKFMGDYKNWNGNGDVDMKCKTTTS